MIATYSRHRSWWGFPCTRPLTPCPWGGTRGGQVPLGCRGLAPPRRTAGCWSSPETAALWTDGLPQVARLVLLLFLQAASPVQKNIYTYTLRMLHASSDVKSVKNLKITKFTLKRPNLECVLQWIPSAYLEASLKNYMCLWNTMPLTATKSGKSYS